jgi:hypothetical protein
MQISAETRWFWPAGLPETFNEWFVGQAAHGCPAGGGGRRDDVYLHDPAQTELGIKLRGGTKGVEVKGLVSVFAEPLDAPPFSAPIELWTKWTTQRLDLGSSATVTTEKTRWLRKFAVDGEAVSEVELDASEAPRSGTFPAAGCNVELTAVAIAGARCWTLGFEAFGDLASVASHLRRVAALIAARKAPPLGDAVPASYPAWLSRQRV